MRQILLRGVKARLVSSEQFCRKRDQAGGAGVQQARLYAATGKYDLKRSGIGSHLADMGKRRFLRRKRRNATCLEVHHLNQIGRDAQSIHGPSHHDVTHHRGDGGFRQRTGGKQRRELAVLDHSQSLGDDVMAQ